MTIPETELIIIKEIYQFIRSNYTEDFKIKDLLSKYPISASTLQRAFKTIFGESIDHYRLRVSMEAAGEMLASGHQVKEVTLNLGYKTTGSFARAFKKIYGVTPSDYSRTFPDKD